MIIVGKYSFNNGEEKLNEKFKEQLKEIENVVSRIDAEKYKTKASEEKTMVGKMLYSPSELNSAIKIEFNKLGWNNHTVTCEYSTKYYTDKYKAIEKKKKGPKPYRDMDFVKDRIGIEVQFGKYAFMVYNVAAKMTIFHKLNLIDYGVEIVPIKQFADDMSTGVSFFEQFIWDLEQRGISNIDIPVLILGIDSDTRPLEKDKKVGNDELLLPK